MAQERQIKQLKIVFTTIKKKTGDSKFKFSEGAAITKRLSSFIDQLEDRLSAVSEERIVDVCVSIAYRFRETAYTVKTMFSAGSIKHFFDAKRGQKFYENAWLDAHGLSRPALLALIADRRKHPQEDFIYMPSEEDRKMRLHNTKAGYMMCQVSTLGWSPESQACLCCQYTDDCKIETERKFPELYRIRLDYGSRRSN